MFSIALYRTEAQKRLSFNAALRLEPGSLTPMQGLYPDVTLAGMELFRMPGRSLPTCVKMGGKKFQTDVGMRWLGALLSLQKHLPLVKPSGQRSLGKS